MTAAVNQKCVFPLTTLTLPDTSECRWAALLGKSPLLAFQRCERFKGGQERGPLDRNLIRRLCLRELRWLLNKLPHARSPPLSFPSLPPSTFSQQFGSPRDAAWESPRWGYRHRTQIKANLLQLHRCSYFFKEIITLIPQLVSRLLLIAAFLSSLFFRMSWAWKGFKEWWGDKIRPLFTCIFHRSPRFGRMCLKPFAVLCVRHNLDTFLLVPLLYFYLTNIIHL